VDHDTVEIILSPSKAYRVFTSYPRSRISLRISSRWVHEEDKTMTCIPDILILLRVGHFYFALTDFNILLEEKKDSR
jgi:hypothetical protein